MYWITRRVSFVDPIRINFVIFLTATTRPPHFTSGKHFRKRCTCARLNVGQQSNIWKARVCYSVHSIRTTVGTSQRRLSCIYEADDFTLSEESTRRLLETAYWKVTARCVWRFEPECKSCCSSGGGSSSQGFHSDWLLLHHPDHIQHF